jgi:hypothetical protein
MLMSETCGFEIAAAANADWLSAAADFLFNFHARHSSKYIHPLHRNSIDFIRSVWSSVMDSDPNSRNNRRKRQASLYDAVAGRVGYEGFLGEDPPTKNRDTVSRSNIAVPPEEVLFRRRGAPIRYEEDDIYSADRHLQPHQRLPDSDLLKTIHAYASDFYANATPNNGKSDWKSLDETALLAMGILLEEAAVEALGKTGDLALVVKMARRSREVLWSARNLLKQGLHCRGLAVGLSNAKEAAPQHQPAAAGLVLERL